MITPITAATYTPYWVYINLSSLVMSAATTILGVVLVELT